MGHLCWIIPLIVVIVYLLVRYGRRKPVILVVNSQDMVAELIGAHFGKKYIVLGATSLGEAERQFHSVNPRRIALIIIDGYVENWAQVDAVPLVKHFRITYLGPMVLAPSPTSANDELAAAAEHSVYRAEDGQLVAEIRKAINWPEE